MDRSEHEAFMRQAIALARQRAITEQVSSPFSCLVVRDGVVIGSGVNAVIANNDPTAHGEVVAIRDACQRLGTHELAGATLYTSGEPCPMCYAAAWWARIEAIYYASTVDDAMEYGDFDDRGIYDAIALPGPDRPVPARELLREEMLEVWRAFRAIPDRIHY